MIRSDQTLLLLLFVVFCIGCGDVYIPKNQLRQKINFDFGWRFTKGDFPKAYEKDFDDNQWQEIDLPHDWSIADMFSEDNPTGRQGGYAFGGIGWYRKRFSLNKMDASAKISIEFGGVYENSEVWINGHFLGCNAIRTAHNLPCEELLDITGYNGGGGSCFMYEKDHETYPERILIATGVPHTFQTRGIYRTQSWYRDENPLGGIMEVPDLTEEEVFTDVSIYYSSSYDNAMVRQSCQDPAIGRQGNHRCRRTGCGSYRSQHTG